MRDDMREGQGQESPRPPADAANPTRSWDWFSLEAFEWMWRKDGLGLRPGADLMVYATIYRASCNGGGAFVATNASMGDVLGYPRETISRTVNKLVRDGLVWVVGHVHDHRGGKAVKCYAVSQAAIDLAQQRIAARHLVRTSAPEDMGGAVATGDVAVENPEDSQGEGNVMKRHIALQGPCDSQQSVTYRHVSGTRCDDTSRKQCDRASHVTERHITNLGPSPAQTPLFDSPLISTYHISTDQGDRGDVERTRRDTGPISLSPTSEAAFAELLRMSVRPVDNAYVDANHREFVRLLGEGVDAEVILTAYSECAEYQRRIRMETGESRPMHLLNWLRQRPNTNIQYVLNRLDPSWRPRHPGTSSGQGQKEDIPSHEQPLLRRCRDGGKAIWLATDEHGTRIVEGSEGVESLETARRLYETMRKAEQPA